jgi:hypothetical protein
MLLLLMVRQLDGLHHPPSHARGHQPSRRGGGRWGAAGHGADVREDWEEERQVARVLEEKIIRKVSMKRWLEERHKFFPTLSGVERLKVEEVEEMRDKILALEGWRLSKKMAQFARPRRTRWEQTAKEASLSSAGEHRGVSASWPMVDLSADLDREPLLGQLRGGCGSTGIARERRVWWLRKMMDGAWSVEFEKDGKVTSLSRVLFAVYLCLSWYFFCVFHVLFIYYLVFICF